MSDASQEPGKPIVIERLDFRQKKAVLEGESRKYSRMLSSFSYGKIMACFLSRGYRGGVEVHQVNPAFSSGAFSPYLNNSARERWRACGFTFWSGLSDGPRWCWSPLVTLL